MIQRNTGYYRDIGIDNIGCVQTTAQPYFQNHYVKLCLFEQPQRRQRTVLEIGQGNITACRFNLRKRGGVGRFRQFLALHTYALGITHQMRRTVDAHFVPCRHQNRLQRTAGGAFAIRTRNGKHKWRWFQDAKTRRDLAHALKAEIDSFTVQVFQIRKPRSQRRRGLRSAFDNHGIR